MCLQPRIIINPSYVKYSSTQRYPFVHMPNRDFGYRRNAFDSFDYKTFSAKRNGVNKRNLESFYAYNLEGETIPLYIEVPCGHCSPCIMQKRSQIKSRLILEQYSHDATSIPLFLTLTYNDANLPADGVSVEDVQGFLKRFRSYVEYHHPVNQLFRYACFSEYSPEKGRAHYHLLIYGFTVSPRDVYKLEDEMRTCWQKGFVYLKMCDYGCFNYVSKYVCKGSNVPYGKNPNFRLSSRRNGGLGVPAFEDESLYFKLIQSPHPIIKVKVMGRVFDVFIPKSIRERLCRSPRQFIPRKIISAYDLFCRRSLVLKVLMNDFPDFASHASHYLKMSGVESPDGSCVVPRRIYDKYAALCVHSLNTGIPYYVRNDKVNNPDALPHLIDEYVKLYKILDDYVLDFDKLFDFTYLRSTVYERWKMSLVQFAEKNGDTDPLSVEKFNAIIVESYGCHPA